MEYKWILFCPQLPATPSSPRVMIWRKMRTAGALGLDNGLWLLPFKPESEKTVQEMKEYVSTQGGSSKSFLTNALDADTENDIIERFLQDRAEEYAELKEQCADFLAEIEKETQRENFSFAEFEENEQDLIKLEVWFQKVQQRDFLGGQEAQDAADWIERCRQMLQKFADEVYAHEEPDRNRKNKYDPGKLL
jgi:hypothetical protein